MLSSLNSQVLIKEITRRCNLCGIFQAAYTAGQLGQQRPWLAAAPAASHPLQKPAPLLRAALRA